MKQADIDALHRFHELYYLSHVWEHNTRYRGVLTGKLPLDLWVYGEIIHETRPNLIIETGSWNGGSALWLADHAPEALVLSIDINRVDEHKLPAVLFDNGFDMRLHFLTGDSATVDLGAISMKTPGRVMVILDSDHSEAHVTAELNRFAPMVTPGCYLIVEDTNVRDDHNDAKAALDNWLPNHPEFIPDPTREKFMLTFNPGGYLRRTIA